MAKYTYSIRPRAGEPAHNFTTEVVFEGALADAPQSVQESAWKWFLVNRVQPAFRRVARGTKTVPGDLRRAVAQVPGRVVLNEGALAPRTGVDADTRRDRKMIREAIRLLGEEKAAVVLAAALAKRKK